MVTITVEQKGKSANTEFKNTGGLPYLLAKSPLNSMKTYSKNQLILSNQNITLILTEHRKLSRLNSSPSACLF